MRNSSLALASLTVSAAVLASCASTSTRGPLVELAEDDLGDLPPIDRALAARADRDQSTFTDNVAALPAVTTIDDFVTLALARNPAIRAAEQRVLRLRERIPQVTSLDDPMAQIAPIGEMAETAAGEVSVMTSVSQRLPFPGKLDARGRIASQDVRVAEQQLIAERLAVVADTRRAFWNLYIAARALEITQRSRTLLTQFRDATESKYRAGTTTQDAVLRATVELSNLENELITLRQQRDVAAAMLNTLIDRPVDAPVTDPAPVSLRELDAELDDLLAGAAERNPSIRAAHEQLERYREQRRLARLDRYPDLTVSFSYNLVDDRGLSPVANGDDQWWIGFGVNLPIWQERRAAAEREATRGALEAAGMLADAENRVAFRIRDALVSVETQRRLAELFRDSIIPQARQTVDVSLSGYRAGETDFLTLIDNWRRLLEYELAMERSVADLERAIASLQQAVGADLNDDGSLRPLPQPTPAAHNADAPVQDGNP